MSADFFSPVPTHAALRTDSPIRAPVYAHTNIRRLSRLFFFPFCFSTLASLTARICIVKAFSRRAWWCARVNGKKNGTGRARDGRPPRDETRNRRGGRARAAYREDSRAHAGKQTGREAGGTITRVIAAENDNWRNAARDNTIASEGNPGKLSPRTVGPWMTFFLRAVRFSLA